MALAVATQRGPLEPHALRALEVARALVQVQAAKARAPVVRRPRIERETLTSHIPAKSLGAC